jgi:hypothetical protein
MTADAHPALERWQNRGMALDQTVLDELWDFADAAGSEARLRAGFDATTDPVERRELRTQVARAMGLQERFTEGHGMLDAIDLDEPVVAVRAALERGRLHNSAGAPVEATWHFRRAAVLADENGLTFLRIDALHMLAIADPEHADEHTDTALRELALVEDPRTRRWLVGLHNNRGWSRLDAGDRAGALEAFEAAKDAADVYGTEQQRVWAAEAIAEVRGA